jgi:hypothetical protein
MAAPEKQTPKKRRVVGDGTPGPGRPKGVPNKTTSLLKDALLKAAENAGNKIGSEGMVSYLTHQAVKNPGPFMSLLGKVLPMQVTGEGGKPLDIVVRIGGDDADA